MLQLLGECYNYTSTKLIIYDQEYLNYIYIYIYIYIIRNIFIYFRIISLLLEGIKSPLFIILISFFNVNKALVLSHKHMVST